MADIFISYSSRRREAAQHLAQVLENYGYSVWFDYSLISGKTGFSEQIEEELEKAKELYRKACEMGYEKACKALKRLGG